MLTNPTKTNKTLSKIVKSLMFLAILISFRTPVHATYSIPDFDIDSNGHLLRYRGESGIVVVPEGVVSISKSVFQFNEDITEVYFPESLIDASNVFYNCPNLEKVVFGSNVQSIERAMIFCRNLKEVVLPDSLTSIPSSTFKHCESLERITLPSTITSIGTSAFEACYSLSEINLPNSITSIGDYAFKSTGITSFSGLDNLQTLGTGVFSYCDSLELVELPNSLISTGSSLFIYSNNIKKVILPTSGTFAESIKNLSLPVFINKFKSSSNYVFENLDHIEYTTAIEKWDKYSDPLKFWSNTSYASSSYDTLTDVANEICEGLTTEYEKAYALSYWLIRHVSYSKFSSIAPMTVYETGLANCHGYSNLYVELLKSQGITSGLALGKLSGSGHAWVVALIDGQIYWIEPQQQFSGQDVRNFLNSYTLESVGLVSAHADDIPSNWAKLSICDAIGYGIVPKDVQNSYRSSISREDFSKLMVTLVEKVTNQDISDFLTNNNLVATNPFTDTTSEWAIYAYALGIVNGTSATSFSPNNTITRQDAATMLSRTAKLLGLSSGESMSFADSSSINNWAIDGVDFVSGLFDGKTNSAVMGSTTNNNFEPLSNYSVEQAIITTLRLYNICK